jgi:hypothetical protein
LGSGVSRPLLCHRVRGLILIALFTSY